MITPLLAGSTRRPGVPVLEVALADGDTWGLALPTQRRHPVVIRERDEFGRLVVRIEIATRIGYRPEIRRLWESILSACREGSAEEQATSFGRLVASLLLAAHDIDSAHAEALLDARRVDLGRIARALLPAAFGEGDLPRSGGR